MKPYTNMTDPKVGKALAHPLRIKILSMLEERTASPSEMADELGVPLTNVSYHVRHLHRLGAIRLVRRTVRRGAVQHYYEADARSQVAQDAWSDVPDIVKRAAIGSALKQVAEDVNAAAPAGGFTGEHATLARIEVRLDSRGMAAVAKELAATQERIQKIARESGKRASADGAAEDATAVLMLFGRGEQEAKPARGGRAASKRGGRSRKS